MGNVGPNYGENMEVDMEDKTTATPEPEKTFTQADIDRIVSERLDRERGKYADYDELKAKAAKFDEAEEASKTELQKATEKATALQAEVDALKAATELRNVRDKVATETGIPVTLLTGGTEEECKAQAEAIKAYAQEAPYPSVKDAGNTHTVKTETRDQFANWMNENFGGN